MARNLHNGHSRSQCFIAGNEASVQQQQPQNAPRERCMLVHHGNIEIDSNDSVFFLRKTRSQKSMGLRNAYIACSIEVTNLNVVASNSLRTCFKSQSLPNSIIFITERNLHMFLTLCSQLKFTKMRRRSL